MQFKTIIALLLLILMSVKDINGQNNKKKRNNFLIEAIEESANRYFELDKPDKYRIYVIYLISIKKNRGIFSISYIYNSLEGRNLRASHYMNIDGKLFLVIADQFGDVFEQQSQANKFNDSIKHVAKNLMHGLRPDYPAEYFDTAPKAGITAQSPSIYVGKYVRTKLSEEYYAASWLADNKYTYYEEEEEEEEGVSDK